MVVGGLAGIVATSPRHAEQGGSALSSDRKGAEGKQKENAEWSDP